MAKERASGTVKWFSREKGYGFIRLPDGRDVFVHHSDIAGDGFKTLRQGESVEFEIGASDRGPKARNIVRLEGAGNGAGSQKRTRKTAWSGRSRARGGSPDPKPGPRAAPEEVGTLAAQLRARLGRRFPWLAR